MKLLGPESENSLGDVHGSIDTTKSKKGWRKVFSFLGPAYLISVGYMDPGNWATDLAGGSQYGYSLIWVLLMSNLMALLLQGLSARLGIVRGRDLAQANREEYPKAINFALYVLAEIAIAAMDLAEVLGMAIGIQLLTGLPLIYGVSITVLDTFLILYLQKLGMRKMEAFILALVGVIFIAFLIQIVMAAPDMREVATGFIPSIADDNALFIAIAIIGATVMPHNLYLHSALVQTRKTERTDEGIIQAIKFNRIDTTIALNLAFLVNAAILVLAATVFFKTGNSQVAEIKQAHELLPGFLGASAPILFAIALIAAGQSSTVTGTLAGQIVMEGYLRLRINPMLRRLLTRIVAIIPAVIVILIYGEAEVEALLIMSQVVLSLQLGYAIIPLIHFVSDKKTMGKFAIKPLTKIAAWAIAIVLIILNIKMLLNEIEGYFTADATLPKIIIIVSGLFFALLLIYITVEPFFKKKQVKKANVSLHSSAKIITDLQPPVFNKIAVALDFSESDAKILSFALGQGHKDTAYILIHIVESVAAALNRDMSDDYETRRDLLHLEEYVAQLKEKNIVAKGILGYKDRVKELVKITKECEAELLVMGGHGHKGLKDIMYGETANAVRHDLKIPVLMVNL